MNDTDFRLDVIRGTAAPKKFNARAVAALASNPGCARRAVLDAAAIDKQALAQHLGYPPRFGLSQFAIARGIAFENFVKDHGCAEILRLLRDRLGLPMPQVSYDDLNRVAGHETIQTRYLRSRQLLAQAARSGDDSGTFFDHPVLQMRIAGQQVYLEPDLVAFQLRNQFHVVEIKSFPIIDGRADPAKMSAAATQSAVYVLALRQLLAEVGANPAMVSDEVFVVCPQDFSNRPTAARVDVRKQLSVLRRQLARIEQIGSLVAALPPGLTLDLRIDATEVARRPVGELLEALSAIEARYAPECLATCEMSFLCRAQARGSTAALGRSVREDLGGIETVSAALSLACGDRDPDEHEYEVAEMLRLAHTLREQCLGGVA
ncbi:hypothetical protein GFY24_40090 [Nocardia sp. SYP-A9097]|uniref:hypothetical protein n=1 Tax=Nocardia sp. SYP-A9097 TaxID=2663237 RepID=UPI00129B6671|nr:hypothetical protein [Nocardia sp. SYP-A9097]MRH93529.1 hypothetical protein [Nocardia sp. SYP-A9097]